jgi:tetratricopeptide (TPR) repeat protein
MLITGSQTMSDYAGPSVDPTNPHATLHATSELIRTGDFTTAGRLLGWALDFNPEHAGLLRRMSELRWEESKVEESLDWAEQALAANRGDAETYAYLGLLRMRQGRHTDAAELLARSVEIKPDNPHYLRRLADIMVHLGRGEDAVDLARRMTALQPRDVQSYNFLASLQQRYGDFGGAEETILMGIRQAPESAVALRRMAEFRLARGDISDARSWAERAREIAPDDPANYDLEANLALIDGDLAAAEEALLAAAGLSKASGYHKRRLSSVLMRRGNRESALAWAEKALADHPQDVVGHDHIAGLHLAQGRHDAAYQALEGAVVQATRPRQVTALMRRLSSLAQQKNRREVAIKWATQAVAANPFDAENHAHLASLHVQHGDLVAAQKAAKLAVDLAPGHAAHSRRMSDIAWRQGETKAAFEWAARSVSANPSDSQNYAHLATLLMRQGQNEAAETPLSRAVELAPMDIGLLTRLSDLKQSLGKQDEAFALAETAISSRPRELIGLNHLATLYLRSGALDEAYAVLGRAVEIEPANVSLLRRLADVAQRRGDDAKALSWLRQALEVDPRDPHSYNQLATLELVRGEAKAAETALKRATELAGSNPAFHRRLSNVLNRHGDERGAVSWAEQTVSDFPGDPAGFLQLGGLHFAAGRLDEAEAAYLKASELASTQSQVIGALHRLSDVAVHRNDIRGAFAWAQRALEVAPREPAAYNHLAGLHLSYGNLSAADSAAAKAVEMTPNDVGVLRRLSDIRLRQGQLDQALRLARQAVAGNLGDAHSHNHEASVLMAAADYTGALAAAERARKLAPTEVTFLRRVKYLRLLLESIPA